MRALKNAIRKGILGFGNQQWDEHGHVNPEASGKVGVAARFQIDRDVQRSCDLTGAVIVRSIRRGPENKALGSLWHLSPSHCLRDRMRSLDHN